MSRLILKLATIVMLILWPYIIDGPSSYFAKLIIMCLFIALAVNGKYTEGRSPYIFYILMAIIYQPIFSDGLKIDNHFYSFPAGLPFHWINPVVVVILGINAYNFYLSTRDQDKYVN